MSSSQLAPAGSSQYTSGTMYVGDGTWDTERNTFLLPNLVGLNFKTMRYNGKLDSNSIPDETDGSRDGEPLQRITSVPHANSRSCRGCCHYLSPDCARCNPHNKIL